MGTSANAGSGMVLGCECSGCSEYPSCMCVACVCCCSILLGLTSLAEIGDGDLDALRFESVACPASLMVQRRGDDTRLWCPCSFGAL